jgi:hypothetical protein
LLDWRHRPRLIRWLQEHVAVIADSSPLLCGQDLSLDLVTDAGTPLNVTRRSGALHVNGHPLGEPPVRVGEHVVLVSDGFVTSPRP